ncbi:hypothetical protein [Streptomyces camelliae]|uniref:Uncharacterized protein n=1 Tax=Streptomyces camelliae TaxID=3004093 RepID=A0ABY7NWM9_9ACTN|nr:hypothetical protein [Streptomyces sp. HUAS 2-6]WBO61654.1 hypothetical protein O1G22_01625 [Streptomyces sp. HUAS 2-6]
MADAEHWVPDARTLLWCFGRADEHRVMPAIRDDVGRRAAELEPGSDAYWLLVSEAAIEAVLYDLLERAKAEGTVFGHQPPPST